MDDTNYNQLLELVKKNRYPSSQNIKYSQNMREEIEDALLIMAIHTADSFLVNPMKPILFEMIKNGDAPPGCLARMIDRGCMIYDRPYMYGMYNWLSAKDMYDIENLDKRRAEIGLPSRKLECEIHNLQVKQSLKNMPKKKQKEYKKDNLFNCNF
jgi:hypothetical protein